MYCFSQKWLSFGVICAILIQIMMYREVEAAKTDDRIVSLPGQPPEVEFKQHAGYIRILDEVQEQERFLFYYLVEAESNPASKPLVLWLSGGPGCSSVGLGGFTENGPFKPSDGGILDKNEYSWNKVANMLYLESPAGVGFSYSSNSSFYDYVNDTITAQDNFKFLHQWFAKYPEYKNRDFYITGESYAGSFLELKQSNSIPNFPYLTRSTGHYGPQLADLVVQSSLFNLKGMALGNPLLHLDEDVNSRGDYYWAHGLISDSTHELLKTTCNISEMLRQGPSGFMSPACSHVYKTLDIEIPSQTLLNLYDVTSDICHSSIPSHLGIWTDPSWSTSKITPKSQYSSTTTDQAQPHAINHPNDEGKVDICIGDKVYAYFNRKDVQAVLHARLVGVSNWIDCSKTLKYDEANKRVPTIDVLRRLVRSGIRVLVYSGDQDTIVPFIGSRRLIHGLAKEVGLNTTSAYKPWFENTQVGGWTQTYGNILTFATVRGASHLSPYSSPRRSLALVTKFLSGTPLV